jgi:hypothetical protein
MITPATSNPAAKFGGKQIIVSSSPTGEGVGFVRAQGRSKFFIAVIGQFNNIAFVLIKL